METIYTIASNVEVMHKYELPAPVRIAKIVIQKAKTAKIPPSHEWVLIHTEAVWKKKSETKDLEKIDAPNRARIVMTAR